MTTINTMNGDPGMQDDPRPWLSDDDNSMDLCMLLQGNACTGSDRHTISDWIPEDACSPFLPNHVSTLGGCNSSDQNLYSGKLQLDLGKCPFIEELVYLLAIIPGEQHLLTSSLK